MLLVLWLETGKAIKDTPAPWVWLSPAMAEERYGLSEDTRLKDARTLTKLGLIKTSTRHVLPTPSSSCAAATPTRSRCAEDDGRRPQLTGPGDHRNGDPAFLLQVGARFSRRRAGGSGAAGPRLRSRRSTGAFRRHGRWYGGGCRLAEEPVVERGVLTHLAGVSSDHPSPTEPGTTAVLSTRRRLGMSVSDDFNAAVPDSGRTPADR
jgi:hypothetical protein